MSHIPPRAKPPVTQDYVLSSQLFECRWTEDYNKSVLTLRLLELNPRLIWIVELPFPHSLRFSPSQIFQNSDSFHCLIFYKTSSSRLTSRRNVTNLIITFLTTFLLCLPNNHKILHNLPWYAFSVQRHIYYILNFFSSGQSRFVLSLACTQKCLPSMGYINL